MSDHFVESNSLNASSMAHFDVRCPSPDGQPWKLVRALEGYLLLPDGALFRAVDSSSKAFLIYVVPLLRRQQLGFLVERWQAMEAKGGLEELHPQRSRDVWVTSCLDGQSVFIRIHDVGCPRLSDTLLTFSPEEELFFVSRLVLMLRCLHEENPVSPLSRKRPDQSRCTLAEHCARLAGDVDTRSAARKLDRLAQNQPANSNEAESLILPEHYPAQLCVVAGRPFFFYPPRLERGHPWTDVARHVRFFAGSHAHLASLFLDLYFCLQPPEAFFSLLFAEAYQALFQLSGKALEDQVKNLAHWYGRGSDYVPLWYEQSLQLRQQAAQERLPLEKGIADNLHKK